MAEDFWAECELVDRDPDRVAGAAVVKGTRVPAETIVIDAELGCTVEETHENFPTVPVETIHKILAYASSHKLQLQP